MGFKRDNLHLDGFAKFGAITLVENEVGNFHLDFGQLDLLVGVKRVHRTIVEVRVATGASFGFQALLPG